MTLHSFSVVGLGPLVDARVDLDALPRDARLIAVVGPNGAGKTTALELALLGAPYRDLPTRGSLVSLATRRDAYVESTLSIGGGRRVRIRQNVDPVSGSGSTSIVDATTGEALTSSTKVTEGDAWVRQHLPTLDVVTASLFAVQGSGGFVDMKPSDRKRVLLRVHGIERIEKLAEAAGKRANAAKGERTSAQARRDEAARAIPEVDDEAVPTAMRAELDAASAAVGAGTHVTRCRAALDEARARQVAARAHEAALDAARRGLARARDRALDLAGRIERNRALLADEARIRETLATLDADRARVTERERALEAATTASREAAAAHVRAGASVRDYERRVEEAQARASDLAKRADASAAAAARLPELEAASVALRAAEDAHEAALWALAALQTAQASRSDQRITSLRAGLVTIRDDGAPAVSIATVILRHDDEEAIRSALYPDHLRDHQAREREAKAAVARARTAHADLVRATQGIDPAASEAYRESAERLDDLRGELHALRYAHEARGDEAATAGETLTAAAMAVRDARSALGETESALRAWPADVASRLDQARARVEELEPQATEAQAALDAAIRHEAELAAVPVIDTCLDLALVDLEEAEAAEKRALAEHRRICDDLAALRVRAEDAERGRARLVELDADLARVDRELARWSRLAADLGRDGVQALLIDAAGPALSALVNELLHACVSTRWTVTIATSRLTGKGEDRETLDLRVLDAESGREGPIESYSGGERVLLGEAVSLALTVAACRTAGVEAPCLVRDESGAALDPERAAAYVAMLRRAAAMVGASRVLLVSHATAVVAACDARLVVEGGAMRLVAVEG
jgi:exonuclease SbcC